MAFLISYGQLLVLATILFQQTASLPVLDGTQEDMEELTRGKNNRLNSLLARNYVDALLGDRRSLSELSGLQTRQLGDIEFSNRYADHLRSKAKLSTICSFLRRVQSIKKSGVGGDVEGVNQLMKQYMCPSEYQWMSDL